MRLEYAQIEPKTRIRLLLGMRHLSILLLTLACTTRVAHLLRFVREVRAVRPDLVVERPAVHFDEHHELHHPLRLARD